MKIAINGQDYTSALDLAQPLTIERSLNEPSTCQLWLSLPANGGMPTPSCNQPLSLSGDDGTYYFTGYIATNPLPEYAGLGIAGPCYRIAIHAVSDELLLDQLYLAPGKGATGVTAGPLLASLVAKTGSSTLSARALTLNAPISNFAPDEGASWSSSAGQVANQARAAYRAMNEALTLSAIPNVVHPLNETDGSLTLANLSLTSGAKRTLANDVTVCGEHEPVAYVTEYLLGDGVTMQFNLAADPYRSPSLRRVIFRELFNESQIDLRLWGSPGGCGYLSLGAGGLVMQGGSGTDGDTLLTWLDPVEMGGTLLLEATGVALSPGSTGVLAGFFVGMETQSACTAGFQVTAQQGTGAVKLQPIVQGTPTGAMYSISPANQYALRIRIHCRECERALSVYRSCGDNGAITYGGQWNIAPGKLQFEIQEYVNGVAGMPVTLYEGSVSNLPGACMVVAASSINLLGQMRGLNLTNLGSGWIVGTPVNGTPRTRRAGMTAQGAECQIDNTGKLVFYNGFAPAAGEQIAVSYRTVGRALGRAINSNSQQALAKAGLPSVVTWIGSVTHPPARSSQDCRNAAMALEQAAAGVSAAWSGTYRGTRAEFAADVWPGDALQLNAPSTNLDAQVVVRTVKLTYQASYPDLVEYTITFANDWADDLAIKTRETVPSDAWLPSLAGPTYLTNLNALAVTSVSGSNVTIDAGATAPQGGGFEIRRRDFAFMPGNDSDLVMRSTEPNMTFSRVSASDRFYIRMYDGAAPPNYSEFSAALFFSLPLGL